MATRGTRVWLYYNEANALVGFGSLGTTRRQFPADSTTYASFSIIPALAVQSPFWGLPRDGTKYSHQILSQLIAEAIASGTELLILDVDIRNRHAIELYMQFGFSNYGMPRDTQQKMTVRLR